MDPVLAPRGPAEFEPSSTLKSPDERLAIWIFKLSKINMPLNETNGIYCSTDHLAEMFDDAGGWRQGKAKTTLPPTERRIACRL